uniref:Small-subunit processome Utp12 domain-containing protein n=1 Tax=Plectus sambesii TaxID=2011161 RepID=A0A914XTB2_9BILA
MSDRKKKRESGVRLNNSNNNNVTSPALKGGMVQNGVAENGGVQIDRITKVHSPVVDTSKVKYATRETGKQNGIANGTDELKTPGKKTPSRRLPQDTPLEERLKGIATRSAVQAQQQKEQKQQQSKQGENADLGLLPSTSHLEASVGSKGDSMVVLLTQGLHSGDTQKLDTVLNSSDLRVIAQTLRDLPVGLVIPLLKELETRLRTRNVMDIRPWIRWVQCALSMHLAYLTSLPSLPEQLSSLHDWMSGRMEHMGKLLALHGKLALLTDQIDRRANPQTFASQNAAVVFQEDSSSESDSDDDMGGVAPSAMTTSGEEEDDEADWWDETEAPPSDDEEEESDEEMDADDEEKGLSEMDDSSEGEDDGQ